MPSIERQTPEMYSRGIDASGYVEELFGCDCVGCHNETLDRPGGSPVGIRGDDNLVFVLDVYMNWRWKAGGGDRWMRGRWPSARLAANWSMATATDELSDSNLSSLPTILGIDYVARRPCCDLQVLFCSLCSALSPIFSESFSQVPDKTRSATVIGWSTDKLIPVL